MLSRACPCECVVGGRRDVAIVFWAVFNCCSIWPTSLICLLKANSHFTDRRQTMATDTLLGSVRSVCYPCWRILACAFADWHIHLSGVECLVIVRVGQHLSVQCELGLTADSWKYFQHSDISTAFQMAQMVFNYILLHEWQRWKLQLHKITAYLECMIA